MHTYNRICLCLIACAALCAGKYAFGQTTSAVADATSRPIKIDISTLSPEVMKCNVCRMRLGLKPIPGGGTLDAAEHDARAAAAQSETIEAQAYDKSTLPSAATTETLPLGNASTEDAGKKLQQFASPADVKPTPIELTNDANPLSDSRLNSPTAIQIELELAKRQLAERSELINKFNRNQAELESKIGELTVANKQYVTNLEAQNQKVEKLNNQLLQRDEQAQGRMEKLKSELESAQRELSVAVATQSATKDELSKESIIQLSDLKARLESSEKQLEEFKSKSESFRRQRDGLERELTAIKDHSTELDKPTEAASIESSSDLAKMKAELEEIRAAKQTLESEIETLRKAVDEGAANAQEIQSLRVQIEQQAAQMLNAQATWDAEKVELQKKLQAATPKKPLHPAPPKPAPSTTEGTEEAKAAPPANAETKVENEDTSSPFRAGPKTKSRAPREPKEESSDRRDF